MSQRKLYRSLTDRKLAGVCGGLGEYFDIDPTLVRIITVVLAIGGIGTGILLYIIAWIIIPDRPMGA
ncbi:MAG: PspC domain-containing protein [candidate division Zixibacteria bacterium]|nr:PspC domain-containing protein [candidate division Zixibacteria bacterium]MDD5426074.1 PspC domain-containing protein [candidate division Zixibacteria bacterium]